MKRAKADTQKPYLDSADFMSSAHSLYRSLGFRDVDGYPEAEHPQDVSPTRDLYGDGARLSGAKYVLRLPVETHPK